MCLQFTWQRIISKWAAWETAVPSAVVLVEQSMMLI